MLYFAHFGLLWGKKSPTVKVDEIKSDKAKSVRKYTKKEVVVKT